LALNGRNWAIIVILVVSERWPGGRGCAAVEHCRNQGGPVPGPGKNPLDIGTSWRSGDDIGFMQSDDLLRFSRRSEV